MIVSQQSALHRPLTFVLAFAAGVSVASIYLSQPLLHTLGSSLDAGPERAGFISTITQLGYALGLCFLVPLGDVLPKKRLILTKLCFLTAALFITSAAPSFSALVAASLVVGVVATVAQDFVPLTADLASDRKRGQAIGTVISGLLLGILCSRTMSGVIAASLGWRWVFMLWGVLVGVTTIIVWLMVPPVMPKKKLAYPRLMASLITEFRKQALLRSSLRTHGLVGFAFSAFWTNLSFYLGGPDFGFSSSKVGLFGLAGAAGALAAPIAGRLSDRRGPRFGIYIGTAMVALSFAVMLAFSHSLIMLIAGAIIFDMGAQMSLISHQTIVYALDPNARSSLNAVFMTSMFLSFAAGSALSIQVFSRFGWQGVLGLGTVAALLSFCSAVRAGRTLHSS